MVPNLEDPLHKIQNDPSRRASVHFGAYLQLNGLLNETDGGVYGVIEKRVMLDQFISYYQPYYKTCLGASDLLGTLRKYGVVKKHSNRKKKGPLVSIKVLKHPDPSNVPLPNVVSRPRLYVDQNRIMRDKFVRSEVISEAHCRLCDQYFKDEQSQILHTSSDLHTFRLQYREKKSSFKQEVNGSIITVESGNSELVLRLGECRSVSVNVLMKDPYEKASVFEIVNVNGIVANPLVFSNNEPINIKVTAKFSEYGAYIYPLVVKILPNKVCLMAELIFFVGSELIEQLAPTSPFVHNKNVSIIEMEGSLIPGERLSKAETKLIRKVPLGEHKIPPVYNKLLLHKLRMFDGMTQNEEEALGKVLKLLCGQLSYQDALRQISQTKAPFTSPLNNSNYFARFQLLLDLEEMQEEIQIKNYDRKNETLKREGSRFFLQVPDLSEGRPSVDKGDSVHIKFTEGNNKKVIYEGIIHEMRADGLLLGLHSGFLQDYNDLKKSGVEPKFDVRFQVNRFPRLNMHRALKILDKHKAYSIVFPQLKSTNYFPPTRIPSLRPWVNQLIENNPEQQRAVKNIISNSSDSAPYLIFGPPGTGKTVTLIETVVQVWHANQTRTHDAKQLVCSPSNESCNNIAKTLINILPPSAKILRLFCLSTEVVPECLFQHSNYKMDNKTTWLPTIEEISAYHIIVTTMVSAGRLVTGGAGGSFRYVYIDECGQATEPEALIAIAGLLTTQRNPCSGQLVLAGDPQQLGPVLASQPAKDFGLGVSFLERLMNDNNLYKKKEDGSGYDPKYITKLVQNFRSHEAILRIPNKLFYDSELLPRGDKAIVNKAVGWKELPNPNFPLLFHGIQGKDERESNSPSYFNRQEIDTVVHYMKKLFKKGLPNYKVQPEDIGVITPYRKQVRKFQKAFQILKWSDKITVGSVEKFQGSEKLIIFISTVRSNIALIDEDYRFKLGFLKNPKRFNVSVTRAKALLVVVGNPNILRHDKQWYQLLKFCQENRAYRGIRFPDDVPPDHQQDHIAS